MAARELTWYVLHSEDCGWELCHADAGKIASFYGNEEEARETARARNAEEVMNEMGWGVKYNPNEGPMQGWLLVLPDSYYPLDSKLYPLANLRNPHPFDLLAVADYWFRENVDPTIPGEKP